MKTILDFQKKKLNNEKISVITCYDFTFASIINQTSIDCVLVGDSSGMVMHGYSNTISVTTDMIATHTQAVTKGATNKLIIADMPFLSYRKSLSKTMDNAEKLIRAGAQAIKIEDATDQLDMISYLVRSGIPVMGHIGLTAQSIHQLGGHRIQGKNEQQAAKLKQDAINLQEAGCFSLVLECIPALLAKEITQTLHIPTIGIGAGIHVDGQVLVLQDMLGLNPSFKPKFLRCYLDGFNLVTSALEAYSQEVKQVDFPTEEHSY